MVALDGAGVAYLQSLFLPRHKLVQEAVALRLQLAVLKRKQPRPKLERLDRLFWIVLCRLWEGWSKTLMIVKPERPWFSGIVPIPTIVAVAVSATPTGATNAVEEMIQHIGTQTQLAEIYGLARRNPTWARPTGQR
jgi:hypothetical protein